MNKETVKKVVELQNKIELLNGILFAYEMRSKLLEVEIDNRKFHLDYDISEILINTIKNLKDVYMFELGEL